MQPFIERCGERSLKSIMPFITKTNVMYAEAFDHSRHKPKMLIMTDSMKIEDYKNKLFDEIMVSVYYKSTFIKQIGPLARYDITAALCRHHNIVIDKVFICGSGPRNAIKLLQLKPLKYKIPQMGITLDYVEIQSVKDAFKRHNYILDDYMIDNEDGDDFESYLCLWHDEIKQSKLK